MRLPALLLGAGLALAAPAFADSAPPAAPAAAPVAPDLLFGRIEAAISAGLLDVARDLVIRAEMTMPPAQLALVRADLALASNSLDEAARGYTALAADPAMAGAAQLGLGLARLRQGDNPAAIAALDLALAADPASVRGWIARGVAADRNRDWSRADAAYARALTLDPGSASALVNRGYSQLLRGRFAEAAADSTRALALDPKLDVARNNLRLAQAMQGDYKNAFKGSTKLNLARDLNTVGFAAMARGDYGIAETFFTRAMQTNPQFDRVAWDNLVYLKQLAHQPTEPGAAQK